MIPCSAAEFQNRFEQMPSDVFDKIKLSHGDIRTIRLEKQFDAVISLFHVMSYQPENEDLNKVFQNAKIHLKSGGIFLFDCWYGPGVLTDRPTIRIKRLQDDKLMITRIAEPVMYVNENRVDVNYQVFIKDKNSGAVEEINECHKMRYLFTPEIKEFFLKAGMNMIGCYEFMTYKQTSYNTWNVVFIGRR